MSARVLDGSARPAAAPPSPWATSSDDADINEGMPHDSPPDSMDSGDSGEFWKPSETLGATVNPPLPPPPPQRRVTIAPLPAPDAADSAAAVPLPADGAATASAAETNSSVDGDDFGEETPVVHGEWDQRGRRVPIAIRAVPDPQGTRYRPPVAMSECSSESQATVLPPVVRQPARRAIQSVPVTGPARAATLQSHTVFTIGADGDGDVMSAAETQSLAAQRAAAASVASGTATMRSDSVTSRLLAEEEEEVAARHRFSEELGYRTGFLRSVPPHKLGTSQREEMGPRPARVIYAADLGKDALRCAPWESLPERIEFAASHCFRRRARQPDFGPVSAADPWAPGADVPEPEDPATEVGFIRRLDTLRAKRKQNAADRDMYVIDDEAGSSTMATSDSDERDSASVDSRPPVEYEESTPSERSREEATDEERARTFDEWQIHDGPRSCGVMLTVETTVNLKMEDGKTHECAVYYREEKKTKGAVDQAGLIDMQYYLSVPDDTVPLVFLIVEKKLFGRKRDVAIGAVTINHPEVQPLKGVTADNTYWEKAAITIPLVDPRSTSNTVGALKVSWHADMRVDKGPDDLFCRICGRLKTVDSDGKRIFCLCDRRRQQEMEMKESLERETREAMLQRQRDKRLAAAAGSAGDGDDLAGDGDNSQPATEVADDIDASAADMAIPKDAEMPEKANDVHEFAKVSKTEYHDGCCVVM